MDPAAADGAASLAPGAALYVALFLAALAGTWLLVRDRAAPGERP